MHHLDDMPATFEGFHYLRRRQDELNVELRLAMRGPRIFGP